MNFLPFLVFWDILNWPIVSNKILYAAQSRKSTLSVDYPSTSCIYVRCGSTRFSQIRNQWRYQKHYFTSFEDYQKMCFLTKFGGCCSKNKPATPLGSLKWSRAWQHHFSSYTHQTLWKVDFWWDLQLVKIWLWYLKALLSNCIFSTLLSWTPSLVGQK